MTYPIIKTRVKPHFLVTLPKLNKKWSGNTLIMEGSQKYFFLENSASSRHCLFRRPHQDKKVPKEKLIAIQICITYPKTGKVYCNRI